MKTEARVELNLTTEPEIITLELTHYVYLEKHGPFLKYAPLAWKEFCAIAEGQIDKSQITAGLGLSRIDKAKAGDAAFVYQAGYSLKSKPRKIPARLQFRALGEKKYACFLLTGAYAQLAAAYPYIFSILEQTPLKLNTGADFCIERCLNDPATTPEEKLKTEILIPLL